MASASRSLTPLIVPSGGSANCVVGTLSAFCDVNDVPACRPATPVAGSITVNPRHVWHVSSPVQRSDSVLSFEPHHAAVKTATSSGAAAWPPAMPVVGARPAGRIAWRVLSLPVLLRCLRAREHHLRPAVTGVARADMLWFVRRRAQENLFLWHSKCSLQLPRVRYEYGRVRGGVQHRVQFSC
jgi:hypothetical protein